METARAESLYRTKSKIELNTYIKSVQFGKVDEEKSTEEKERICFKNYFDEKGQTYFVVVEYYPDFIKIITVIKKKGKY